MIACRRIYDVYVRTTLTLDDDVAARLHEIARQTGRPFKRVVNETLRSGLAPAPSVQPYVLPSVNLGLKHGVDLTKALRIAADLEDEATAMKLELRK